MEIPFTKIYILRDPNDLQIRYVGKSNNPYERTFGHNIYRIWKSHIEDAEDESNHTHKANWIRKLLKNNQLPILCIIDEVPVIKGCKDKTNHKHWEWWEIQYIKLCKEIGCKLTNHPECKGGEGGNPMKGKHHTEEAKKKISKANEGNKKRLGTKHTEESKLKNSISNKKNWDNGLRPVGFGRKKGYKCSIEERINKSIAIKKWWLKRKGVSLLFINDGEK